MRMRIQVGRVLRALLHEVKDVRASVFQQMIRILTIRWNHSHNCSGTSHESEDSHQLVNSHNRLSVCLEREMKWVGLIEIEREEGREVKSLVKSDMERRIDDDGRCYSKTARRSPYIGSSGPNTYSRLLVYF